MNRLLWLSFCLISGLTICAHNAGRQPEDKVKSPTEGVTDTLFVNETDMQADLLQMLANFSLYMKNDFQECVAANSVGEACGCFRGENTMANDERGVRPNADLSMVCAFLAKYGKGRVLLPDGVTWDDLQTMAMKSLVFAYSTHKANKLKVCSGGNYWGSVSESDHVWESSLWAMSVAYSAFFQWDILSEAQRGYIYQLLKAECNYELQRSVPTGYVGDTKAEENGWEADVLAATLGLFPDDELATQWFERLRLFAINSYSHADDASDTTVIDPDYDPTTVSDLYRGQNLYDDYTLQNHHYFHTSYQNVVIQELGEAALALKLFQNGLYGKEQWKTNALMHNNDRVMKDVLCWLALADGELAMPNGNDWSLFLFDQITSYSTSACFLRDADALMLENLAYKMIRARQTTTHDGSWLLRADVGARRMGVEAHRVMMTWLMHEHLSTADLRPSTWSDFLDRHSLAKVFDSQNIVRAANKDRFTCFSWSSGLKSYTGYLTANSVDKNKIVVPYRANNTGNLIGWYEVSGKATNVEPVVSGIYQLNGNAWVMNGELQTNDAALNHRFAIYSSPGNPLIYIDNVRASMPCTITAEKGALLAVSVDELTKLQRTLYYNDADSGGIAHRQTDGRATVVVNGPWVNVDNQLAIVTCGHKQMTFGERADNNSIMTAKLYGSYSDENRTVKANDVVDRRQVVYYSNITAEATNTLARDVRPIEQYVPEGWNGVIVPDNDGTASTPTCYLLLSNFCSDSPCRLQGVSVSAGKPVFSTPTTIDDDGSSAKFFAEENHSVVNTLRFFINGSGIYAVQASNDPSVIFVQNLKKGRNKIVIEAAGQGKVLRQKVTFNGRTRIVRAAIVDSELLIEAVPMFPIDRNS